MGLFTILALGMLIKCLDPVTRDILSNDGALEVKRLDYIATILAIRALGSLPLACPLFAVDRPTATVATGAGA